jgi:hypothetical protein
MSEETTQVVQEVVQAPQEDSIEIMRLKNERSLEKFNSPFESAAALRHFTAAATVFAQSQLVPKHLQGKVQDCLILMNMALRMQEDPLLVLQNCFVVSGTPGFKTQFLIARANASGQLKSKIRWTVEQLTPATLTLEGFSMPNLRVTASAVDNFGELMESTVTSDMAIREKWTSNPKYRSMPEHMLRWRSAAFLIRLYMPEVMMGMQTIEEIEDVVAANPEAQVGPSQGFVRLSDLKRIEAPAPVTITLVEPPEALRHRGAGCPGGPAGVAGTRPGLRGRRGAAGGVLRRNPRRRSPPSTPASAPIADEVKNTLRGMLQGRNVTKTVLTDYLDTEFGVSNLSGLKAKDVVQVTTWITQLPMKG